MGGPIRVLHVDDEAEFTSVTAEFLEREDDRFEVTTATGADEGLDVLEETDVDCIVSDYEMPGRNGIGFLETVRETRPDLPFILFTGKGSEEIASDAISAGVSDYLQKRPGSEQYTLLANRIRNAVEAHEAEQAAMRAKDQLRQIIDLIPDGVFAKDENLEYILANETFANAFGMSPQEIVGKTDFHILPEERAREFRETDRKILDREESELVYEGAYIRHDDTRQFHQTTKIPFEIAGTDRKAVLGYSRNVTGITEYEQELERTDERLRQVTATVSQDLQDLIDDLAEALAAVREADTSAAVEPCTRVVEQMGVLTQEVEELIDDGTTDVDTGEVGLHHAAQAAWETLETAEARLDVLTDRTIRADEPRLHLLFENLFENAIAHGGEEVTVQVGLLETGFFLADDGTGIPADRRGEVLDAGFSTSGGSGLGLSLVDRVASVHGWELDVTESDDGGARVEVTGVAFGTAR